MRKENSLQKHWHAWCLRKWRAGVLSEGLACPVAEEVGHVQGPGAEKAAGVVGRWVTLSKSVSKLRLMGREVICKQ